jgi:hypothetical protein
MFTLAVRPTQLPIQLVLGIFFLQVKWLGCEAEYSSPPHAEVKNEWSYTPALPLYVFVA